MRNRVLFIVSGVGLLLALVSAFLFSQQPKTPPPLFPPAANPYPHGIYSNGVIESDQAQGNNINIYPEVTGPITQVLVSEGQSVRKGDPLVTIDDSVQREVAEQQKAQADAAAATLAELRAEPRRENLAVAAAQVRNAQATLKSAQDQLAKQQHSYDMDSRSVSQDALDNARNAEAIAATNLEVIEKQFALTRAGAWSYDIQSEERTHSALDKAYLSSAALLAKYTLRAPSDGVVLAVNSGVGSFVSTQGAYNTYTEGFGPLIVMGLPQNHLQVRAYVDEILVHELPDPSRIHAEMFIRGTTRHLPLTFVRVQPYITPKIELSDQREERVDLRVLPLVFRFEKPGDINLYPGQLVDVYVGAK
ncbi:MAG TPA: biotin/lipoyl-binding protein [Steroidobacteraceae bacterium]|nr:biotin/lipoyl-binding protein [Steroidobacteraceae bacterium]